MALTKQEEIDLSKEFFMKNPEKKRGLEEFDEMDVDDMNTAVKEKFDLWEKSIKPN